MPRSAPPGQLLSALFTAWMINAMSTSAPLGIPCGHAKGCALPSAMFTIVISSLTVTSPPPSQSPTHGIGGVVEVGDGVGVGLAVIVTVGVAVVLNVGVGVLVGVLVTGTVAVCVGVALGEAVGVRVDVVVGV
jgi:hypothetical protein